MTKFDWIEKRTASLITNEGTGLVTASILANALADNFERKLGAVSAWPEPEQQAVHPLSFLTPDDGE